MDINSFIYMLGFEGRRLHSRKRSYTRLFNSCRIKKRYSSINVKLDEREIVVPDPPSFAWQIKEIFMEECYRFKSLTNNPLILDLGANIGTSVLWFKHNYPNSRIIAYEASKDIFEILSNNVNGIDVTLENKAIWISDELLSFHADGADAGSLVDSNDSNSTVQGVRLKTILEDLTEPVEFLKMDIEGAETKVIEDCRSVLGKANNIFIEYHSFKNHPQSLGRILSILSENCFRYYLKEVNFKRSPFLRTENEDLMDCQVEIYAFK